MERCATQVILLWVRALGFGNASHSQKVGGMRVRPSGMSSLLRADFKMLKNTSIKGVNKEIWQFEWDTISGEHLGISVA